ncbi:MAG: 50S ribosomal protein L30 [Firmicutes bacterium]|nr:50S ribosomal protein L30 [Bacillota bacterium]
MARKKTTDRKIQITLIHSAIGRSQVQKDTVKALGFKKLYQTIEKPDNPAIRGMIKTIEHLVEVKEA